MAESLRVVKHNNEGKTKSKMDSEEAAKNAAVEVILARGANKSIAEQISGHHFYYKGYYWTGCKQAFENDLKHQHVDKFYPFAEGGPLFVDEVKANDNRDFEYKKAVMKKLGHRYLVVTHGMSAIEAYEAMA